MKILQVLILIFGLMFFTNAQVSEKSFTLNGTVYDAVGAVIPEAKVTAINEQGKNFDGITNSEGIYFIKLPFNKNPSAKSKIEKFKIIVNLENRGFEKFLMNDFKFVPVYSGKMYFDIVLDSLNPEPCGYSGADCLESPIVKKQS